MQGSQLHKNGYVVIDGRPCKIVEISFPQGDNGDSFVDLVGIDIFTGKRLDHRSLSTDNFDVPDVLRQEWELSNVDDGYLDLLDTDGNSADNVKIPEGDLGKMIVGEFEAGKALVLTTLSTMGMQEVVSYREA
ncbi:eukaryotic translation initiation factor 5A [Aspergillus unguis]